MQKHTYMWLYHSICQVYLVLNVSVYLLVISFPLTTMCTRSILYDNAADIKAIMNSHVKKITCKFKLRCLFKSNNYLHNLDLIAATNQG